MEEAIGAPLKAKEPKKPILFTTRPKKNPAAVALGKLGGVKGGKARAEKLSPERRKAIAQRAAKRAGLKLKGRVSKTVLLFHHASSHLSPRRLGDLGFCILARRLLEEDTASY